jgi:hypothetical protein
VAPWLLVIIAALIGAMWNGAVGLLLGATAGVLISILVGAFVRKAQGGVLPRKVRRELIVNLQRNFPDTVGEAFPGLEGDALFAAMADAIEQVGRRAVTFAPSNSDIWTAPVIGQTLNTVIEEEKVPEMQAFYLAMAQQIARDWYAPR